MERVPKVAIVYLSYHAESHLDDFVAALKKITYPKEHLTVLIVDNPHPDFGLSAHAIAEKVLPFSGTQLPNVVYIPQQENIGFAGGNNVGVNWALQHEYQYIYFHNDDGFLAPDAITVLVQTMEQDTRIALAQSLIVLHPDTAYVNSAGNLFHYLGFGYSNEYRSPVSEVRERMRGVQDIHYASGAGVMARGDLLKAHGAWNEAFFMYHEDMELSLRMRVLGYRIVLVPDSVFYHKYQFQRSMQKFYWMERNRFAVLLMYYTLPTILLLMPIAFIIELGLWIQAGKNGWWKERWKVYQYWMRKEHWSVWLGYRKEVQGFRKVRDRVLLQFSVGTIIFQEKSMENPLLQYIANPLMSAYWRLLRAVVRW
ncbi:MAG TPA: glycosyltransferase family 2 protein [Candidatus Kapabacteria bacterium]|nr:glycosyltransferase family 2 protein [Candidatus Kapabacteria bacterium]